MRKHKKVSRNELLEAIKQAPSLYCPLNVFNLFEDVIKDKEFFVYDNGQIINSSRHLIMIYVGDNVSTWFDNLKSQ